MANTLTALNSADLWPLLPELVLAMLHAKLAQTEHGESHADDLAGAKMAVEGNRLRQQPVKLIGSVHVLSPVSEGITKVGEEGSARLGIAFLDFIIFVQEVFHPTIDHKPLAQVIADLAVDYHISIRNLDTIG